MNSSKAPASPRGSDDAEQEFRRRRRRLGAVVLLAGGAALAALPAAVFALRPQPGPLVDEARRQLARAVETEDDTVRFESTAAALDALERAEGLAQWGHTPTSTANALHAAALALAGHGSPDRPIGDADKRERLMEQIRPREASTADLLLAAAAFYRARALGEADFLLIEVLKRDEERTAALRLAADVRYDLGREADVLAHCEELVRREPTDPLPWKLRSYVYEDRGDADGMIAAYRGLLERQDDPQGEVRQALLRELIRDGQAREARRSLDAWRDSLPANDSAVSALEAQLLLLEGRPAEALAAADLRLADAPDDAAAHLLRGRVLLGQGDAAGAEQALRRAAELDFANQEIRYALSQALARQGRLDEAEEQLTEQRRLLDLKGRIHRLERRAGRNPGDVESRRELVGLYLELGDEATARFWQAALRAAGGE